MQPTDAAHPHGGPPTPTLPPTSRRPLLVLCHPLSCALLHPRLGAMRSARLAWEGACGGARRRRRRGWWRRRKWWWCRRWCRRGCASYTHAGHDLACVVSRRRPVPPAHRRCAASDGSTRQLLKPMDVPAGHPHRRRPPAHRRQDCNRVVNPIADEAGPMGSDCNQAVHPIAHGWLGVRMAWGADGLGCGWLGVQMAWGADGLGCGWLGVLVASGGTAWGGSGPLSRAGADLRVAP